MDLAEPLTQFAARFLAVLAGAAPSLLFGALAAGLIEVFLGRGDLARLIPRRTLPAALVGSVLGLLLPVGEYGVIPVTRALLRKGMPLPAAVAFLLAGPAINPIALAGTTVALRDHDPSLLALRVAVALVSAALIGTLARWLPGRWLRPVSFVLDAPPRAGLRRALIVSGREIALLSRYLLIAALLTAGVRLIVAPGDFESLAGGRVGAVLALQARAFALPTGTPADAFAARDLSGVFARGAVLAFLTWGAMLDLTGTALLLSVLLRRAVFALLALTLLITALAGVIVGADGGEQPRARLPRAAFIAPADAYPRNIYLADLETGDLRPLTDAPHGVEDFAPSPDGTQIAYTRNNDDGTADIWVVEVAGGRTRPLTRCVRALCTAPAWHPDGMRLAYQRQEFSAAPGDAARATRAWVVDVSTAHSALLFPDAQLLGADPAWSPDGRRVAVYDARAGGIRVHDRLDGSVVVLTSEPGETGSFAPDGARLVYPVLVRGALGQEFYAHLVLADLSAGTQLSLSGAPDALVDDGLATWSPDGARLVVARRYLDERYTAGKQLYTLDAAAGDAALLLADAAYTHAAPQWDATGRYVLYQRFALAEADAQPEVWVLDTHTGQARMLAQNAFLPAWLP
ncbi:MAG: permease [Anaerolineae bacterium]|nr:permease [Anaerolineae bacterium]